MSWMARLYETYELGIKVFNDSATPMMPICHTTQNAHINILLDADGNFLEMFCMPATFAAAFLEIDLLIRFSVVFGHAFEMVYLIC